MSIGCVGGRMRSAGPTLSDAGPAKIELVMMLLWLSWILPGEECSTLLPVSSGTNVPCNPATAVPVRDDGTTNREMITRAGSVAHVPPRSSAAPDQPAAPARSAAP